jgi:hypothetical protein
MVDTWSMLIETITTISFEHLCKAKHQQVQVSQYNGTMFSPIIPALNFMEPTVLFLQ